MSTPELATKIAPHLGGLVSLEQLHAYPQCTNPRAPHLLGINPHEHTAIYVQGRCKLWSCPECGPLNAATWVARVIHGIHWYIDNGHPNWYLMTITANRKWRGTASSLKNLRGGWRRLAQRIYRKAGKSRYVRFFEHHKDGSLHMHYLTTAELPYTIGKDGKWRSKWLKDSAKKCGMGYNTDYRECKNPAIAGGYAAKYLAKTLEKRSWPKDIRRVQASRGWPGLPVLPDKTGYQWEFLPSYGEVLARAARLWQYQNLLITSVPLGRSLTSDDFGDFLVS